MFPNRNWSPKPPIGAFLRPGHPLARGLFGEWRITEGAGLLVNDSVGYGHGRLRGSTGYPAWATGKYGHQLDMDYTKTQYIEVADNPSRRFNPKLGLTVQIVFYMPSSLTNAFSGLLTKSNSNLPGPFDAYYFSSGTVRTLVGDGSSTLTTLDTAASLSGSNYHDVVFTYDSVNTKNHMLYVDGRLDNSAIGSATTDFADTANAIRIGNRNDDATPIQGSVVLARVWNRALTAIEVAAVHQ